MKCWLALRSGVEDNVGEARFGSQEKGQNDVQRVSPMFDTNIELVAWVEATRKHCVFYDNGEGYGFIRRFGIGDGNYAGTMCSPYTLRGEFEHEHEAEALLNELTNRTRG